MTVRAKRLERSHSVRVFRSLRTYKAEELFYCNPSVSSNAEGAFVVTPNLFWVNIDLDYLLGFVRHGSREARTYCQN